MPQTPPRRLRDARGPVAAAVATSGALLAHLIGGGGLPGWLGMLVPFVLSLTLCTLLAGRSLSLWRTTVSVTASQLLFHLLFVLGTPWAGGGLGGAAGGSTAHAAHGDYQLPPPGATSPYVPDLIGADATMWFWHGVAAAVTVVVLYGGERSFDRLRGVAERATAWLGYRLPVPAAAPQTYPSVRITVPDWFTGSFAERPWVSSSRRRGPPRACAT